MNKCRFTTAGSAGNPNTFAFFNCQVDIGQGRNILTTVVSKRQVMD